MKTRMTPEERLARNYTVADNGCWLWTGAVNTQGYGIITFAGRTWRAPRFSYTVHHGPIPAGLVLDHFVCENPRCINPDHVRPVTQRENALRSKTSQAAIHAAKTHCKRGHPLEGEIGQRRCLVCIRQRPAQPAKPRAPRAVTRKAKAVTTRERAPEYMPPRRVPATLRGGLAALMASRQGWEPEAAATSPVAQPRENRQSIPTTTTHLEEAST